MKISFATFFAIAAISTNASEFRMTIPLASKHFFCASKQCNEFNETNLGLGVEYAGYGIISYENSYSRQSVAAYKAFEYDVNPYMGLGIRVGGVTGYKEESGKDVIPLAQPYLKALPIDWLTFNLGFAPVGLIDTKNYKLVVTLDSQISF